MSRIRLRISTTCQYEQTDCGNSQAPISHAGINWPALCNSLLFSRFLLGGGIHDFLYRKEHQRLYSSRDRGDLREIDFPQHKEVKQGSCCLNHTRLHEKREVGYGRETRPKVRVPAGVQHQENELKQFQVE